MLHRCISSRILVSLFTVPHRPSFFSPLYQAIQTSIPLSNGHQKTLPSSVTSPQPPAHPQQASQQLTQSLFLIHEPQHSFAAVDPVQSCSLRGTVSIRSPALPPASTITAPLPEPPHAHSTDAPLLHQIKTRPMTPAIECSMQNQTQPTSCLGRKRITALPAPMSRAAQCAVRTRCAGCLWMIGEQDCSLRK
jgi:hypothetical protein